MLTVYKNATIKLENVTGAAQATAAERGKKGMNVMEQWVFLKDILVHIHSGKCQVQDIQCTTIKLSFIFLFL